MSPRSHRSDAWIWPSWFVNCKKSSVRESTLSDTVRQALLDDVKSWNDETLARALGMAEGYLTRPSDASPLFLDGAGPISESTEDQDQALAGWPRTLSSDPEIVRGSLSN